MTTDLARLASLADLADVFGVLDQQATKWRRIEGFPQPILTVARGTVPLWDREEVIDWFAHRPRADWRKVPVNQPRVQHRSH